MNEGLLEVRDFFPMWNRLDAQTQAALTASARPRQARPGDMLHSGSAECTGLILVRSGQLRAFALSEDGREVTLYRLLERDICLFSASCMVSGLQLDLAIRAERDSAFWLIPAEVYRRLMETSASLSAFTSQLMAGRFSDVMWLVNEILWKRFDRRLAAFLLEERALEGSDRLRLTHEAIGGHLGTAREVVTRMLNDFRDEGLVRLSRGVVEIADADRLRTLAEP